MSSHHMFGPCHRCGRGGHLARECSLHVCFRCNGRGHMAWECVEGVTCSRCGERGHLQRNCKNVSCHKCGRKGHISKFCNDPFIKAEQVERNERHQAFLKSQLSFGQGSGQGGLASAARAISGSEDSQKVAPGPWDGLGDPGQDRTFRGAQASGVGVATGKPGTNKSQSGILGNVKVITVKRKISLEENTEIAKRRPHQNCGNMNTDIGRNPTSPLKDPWKRSEPIQWNGLLGYASDDSRDDCHTSREEMSNDQNCNLEEDVQMKLKSNVDERNCPVIDLQSSLEEPTQVDERNGSETGFQSSVEKEPVGMDEKNDFAITKSCNVEEEPLTGAVPKFVYKGHVKDASQQANVHDSQR